MALLAIAGTSTAQTENALTVADIELPKNYEASLVVSFQFDAADTYTGYSFNLELPSELEFVMAEGTDVAFTKGACHDASHSVTANLNEGLVKVAGLSLSSKTLTGTSGTLLTFTIKPKSAVTAGQIFTGTIKDILIVPVEGAKKSLANSTFTITIGEDADLRTILDETSTTAPEAATGVDVRVKRTINANQWSTICLPFAMDATQVKAAFGNDVQLGDFDDIESTTDAEENVTAINVKFNAATAIEANHPYIIKVTSPITEFTVDAVDIDPQDASVDKNETKVKISGKWYYFYDRFIGTYIAETSVPDNNLFLSGNKFWYSKGNTKTKAFRAYFDFQVVLSSVDDSTAPVFISFGDETTGIKNVQRTLDDGAYYNLSGQRVETPAKGLYIKDGKKVIVK